MALLVIKKIKLVTKIMRKFFIRKLRRVSPRYWTRWGPTKMLRRIEWTRLLGGKKRWIQLWG